MSDQATEDQPIVFAWMTVIRIVTRASFGST